MGRFGSCADGTVGVSHTHTLTTPNPTDRPLKNCSSKPPPPESAYLPALLLALRVVMGALPRLNRLPQVCGCMNGYVPRKKELAHAPRDQL